MKDFMQYLKAHDNGVAINNEMVKDEEIRNIKNKYMWADEMSKSYNYFSKKFQEPIFEGDNRIRDEFLSEMKYHMYYPVEWEY